MASLPTHTGKRTEIDQRHASLALRPRRQFHQNGLVQTKSLCKRGEPIPLWFYDPRRDFKKPPFSVIAYLQQRAASFHHVKMVD